MYFGKLLHVNTMKLVKDGNTKCFLRNKGKDMKQQHFFHASKKQYTVVDGDCFIRECLVVLNLILQIK